MSRPVARATVERLMPHQGASLMLDTVLDWVWSAFENLPHLV